MVDDGDWIPLSDDPTIQAATGLRLGFVLENGVVTCTIQADFSIQNPEKRSSLFLVGLFDPKSNRKEPTRTIWCPVTAKSVKIKNGSTHPVLLIQFRLEANEENYNRQYIYSIERLKTFPKENLVAAIKSLRRYKMDDQFRTAVHQELGINS
ncbi:MAG: hypothetical protein JNL67_16205 [Planctomycetaceae bacterium]|nr:hypothetical protein [Planctomycetaceae bacterium]